MATSPYTPPPPISPYAPPSAYVPGFSVLPTTPVSRPRRPSMPLIAAATAVAVLFAGGAWAVFRSGGSDAQAAQQTASDAFPASNDTVVTPGDAERILTTYWPVHETALVERDLPALARLSTGPAREWEQPAVACHCLDVRQPRPLLATAYFVPPQPHYPASFVAEAQTEYDGTSWTELLVFSKESRHGRWLVSEDSGFGPRPGTPPTLGRPATIAGGYTAPVPAAEHRRAVSAADDFAALWQRAKNTGVMPGTSHFDLTGRTGERVAYLASHRQNTVQANGLVGHFTFYASPEDKLVEVAGLGGYDIACRPVRETVVYTPQPGQVIYQDAARRNWGPNVAPGAYHRVVSRDVWQTCFVIPSERSMPIGVLDQDIGGGNATAFA